MQVKSNNQFGKGVASINLTNISGPNHELRGKITIQTIDGCQGSEADIVILSLVRSNNYGDVGFLKHDFRRFNVALTRAIRHMFVVCNVETLEN